MHEEIIRDHFIGGVYGLIIGNALGTPFEDRSGGEISMRMGDKPLDLIPDTRGRMAPGEWTDDAALAMATMKSFSRCRGFEAEHIANEYAKYLATKPKRLLPYTRSVLNEIDRDFENWHRKGAEQWYDGGAVHAGNGLMAACMVPGFYYNSSIQEMIDSTIELCQLVYFDPRCVETALVLNFALIQCLHNRSTDNLAEQSLAFLHAIRRDKRASDNIYEIDATRIRHGGGASIYLPYSMERHAVDEALAAIPTMRQQDLHTTRYCVSSMQVALWALANTDNFFDCVSVAVRLGGNADTQGALAGALAGAKYGLAQVPRDWVARVQDSAAIMGVGESLLSTSSDMLERVFDEDGRPASALPPVI